MEENIELLDEANFEYGYNLTFRQRCESIARILSYRPLTQNDVFVVLSIYLDNDLDSNYIQKISYSGLEFAYATSNPLISASIYYNNILPYSPDLSRTMQKELSRTFKNMILGKGRTNIKIESKEDYENVAHIYATRFHLDPPSVITVFHLLLKENSLKVKLRQDTDGLKKILNIFDSIPNAFNLLQNVINSEISGLITSLSIQKEFEIDMDRINSIEEKISNLRDENDLFSRILKNGA